jgi:hypothetical protein
MRQRRQKAMANDTISPKVHRLKGSLTNKQTKPIIVALLRCISTKGLPPARPPDANSDFLQEAQVFYRGARAASRGATTLPQQLKNNLAY